MNGKLTLTKKGPGKKLIFHNWKIVINNDTRGILLSGDVQTSLSLFAYRSRYIPFQLIKQIEIKYPDGGMVVCNNPTLLQASLDTLEI